MTPRESTGVLLEVYTKAHSDLAEALRELAPTVKQLSQDLSAVMADMKAEEHRRRHPRIRDNLPKLHRRYRRQP